MMRTPLEAWIAAKIGSVTLTRGNLEQWQLHKLQETINYVRNRSPFYRELLKNHVTRLRGLTDFLQLPFTTAAEICSQPQRFLCTSQSEFRRVVTLHTSGTTGACKRFFFTAADLEQTLDFFAVGMSTFTRAGDRVFILLPGELPDSVGDLLARALLRIGACGVHHGPVHDTSKTLSVMQQEHITCIVGIPTQVLKLARCSYGLPLAMRNVLLTTDYVPDAIRDAVEKAWECRVYNHYGMTETGLGGGVDCEAQQGYHLREADLYFEIIDPATGTPLPDGETGEVVFTTLNRAGMPLIRYRTGDLARMLPGECDCGTMLRRMEHVRGRLNHRIELSNGAILTLPDLDEALFAVEGLLNYKATVVRGTETCRLQLQVSAVPGAYARVKSESRSALHYSPALRQAFLDGSLVIQGVEPWVENAVSNGTAKRALSVINDTAG